MRIENQDQGARIGLREGRSAADGNPPAVQTPLNFLLVTKVKSGWADDERVLKSLGYE